MATERRRSREELVPLTRSRVEPVERLDAEADSRVDHEHEVEAGLHERGGEHVARGVGGRALRIEEVKLDPSSLGVRLERADGVLVHRSEARVLGRADEHRRQGHASPRP